MGPEHSQADRRQPSLALICLTLFMLILPLTLTKPGLPPILKADEAAFYLGSLSLWHDGDLICDDLDARRLFREFASTDNLLLMSEGRGEPAYFSVPVLYSVIAAPLVGQLGANGMVLLNSALLMAMLWMGASYLSRFNSEPVAVLYASGFFILSTAFVYVFWLQAEVFNMACVMTAFYLIEQATAGERDFPRSPGSARRQLVGIGAAAALLAFVIYSKPMLAMLALPMIYRLLRMRSWRAFLTYAVSGVATGILLAALAYSLTEQVWPYFAPRAGVSLSSPVDYVERRVDPRMPKTQQESAAGQISRGGEQLRITMLSTLRQAVPEFLVGRHGGFLIYMPFAVLSILYFLIRERGSGFRWLILLSTAATAVLFVTVVRGQWLGGGGFIGNRYFATAYPAFIFLVRRLRPVWLIPMGFAAAAVFLGPLMLTPLGALVPQPTLQAHVRNQPFPQLPLEWSLVDSLAGYQRIAQDGFIVHGRQDEVVARGPEVWVRGATRVDMNLLANAQARSFVIGVRALASDNTVEICLQDDCRTLEFGEVPPRGARKRLIFESTSTDTIPRSGGRGYRHRLTVRSEWGEQPRWRGSSDERFYLGAALTFLGTAEELDHDIYDAEWLRVDAPSSLGTGTTATVPFRLRNSSGHAWKSRGAARVRIGARWLDELGEPIAPAGKRTDFPRDIAAGEDIEASLVIDAPDLPGRYTLELDLLRERLGWFSKKNPKSGYRINIQVEPSASRDTPLSHTTP